MVIGATRPRRARVASASTPRPAVGRAGVTPLVDAAFACLAIATAVWYFHLSRGQSFHHDDWQIVQRYDDGLASLFRPHNGHLSLIPLFLYRLLFGLVGLRTYTPFRALGLMCLVAMAAAVYCLARARVGAVLALVAGIGVLWLPGTRQFPFLLNFYIPLTAAVVCAAAMTWTRRYGDIAIGAALTVALCSSAVGVSVAVACIVHAALARARWRRWIAILLPMSGWAVWWLTMARHSLDTVRDNPFLQLSIGGRARLVWRGIIGTFDVLAAGRHGLGIALAVLFAGFVVWRVASRSSAGIGALAWSAAVVAWWVGVVASRSWYGFDAPRYRHVAAVPERQPRGAPVREPAGRRRRGRGPRRCSDMGEPTKHRAGGRERHAVRADADVRASGREPRTLGGARQCWGPCREAHAAGRYVPAPRRPVRPYRRDARVGGRPPARRAGRRAHRTRRGGPRRVHPPHHPVLASGGIRARPVSRPLSGDREGQTIRPGARDGWGHPSRPHR